MKALHLLALFLGSAVAQGALLWQSGGVDLDTLDLTLGATATVTLYQDDPAAHFYSVMMGSVVKGPANISGVTPLFLAGDLGKAVSLGGDEWQLSAGWSGPAPISVWGNHWEVTFEGGTLGDWVYDSGTGDRCTLHVIPEPKSAVWLGVLALVAGMTRRTARA
jgi:hypothetical protein